MGKTACPFIEREAEVEDGSEGSDGEDEEDEDPTLDGFVVPDGEVEEEEEGEEESVEEEEESAEEEEERTLTAKEWKLLARQERKEKRRRAQLNEDVAEFARDQTGQRVVWKRDRGVIVEAKPKKRQWRRIVEEDDDDSDSESPKLRSDSASPKLRSALASPKLRSALASPDKACPVPASPKRTQPVTASPNPPLSGAVVVVPARPCIIRQEEATAKAPSRSFVELQGSVVRATASREKGPGARTRELLVPGARSRGEAGHVQTAVVVDRTVGGAAPLTQSEAWALHGMNRGTPADSKNLKKPPPPKKKGPLPNVKKAVADKKNAGRDAWRFEEPSGGHYIRRRSGLVYKCKDGTILEGMTGVDAIPPELL